MKLNLQSASLALASLVALPYPVSASTTVTNVGGVEVIIARPDAVIRSTNARPKHIRSSHGSQVAVAAAVPPIGLTGGDHLLREGLALVGTP
ncbi:MAG: hypothetical protein IAI50_04795, partial [Candidatus Eremiobacteraeota bacterium]|nr:hypothetical protein [Candidatus Eremiobacteraeota bacterium]